jgi:hypothetical protein
MISIRDILRQALMRNVYNGLYLREREVRHNKSFH